MSQMLRFRLAGGFRTETTDAEDKTPSGMKNQALIALLLTAPEYKRTRSWLQSKLWSDRAPSQASGSLRQALVQIRQSLGDHGDILRSSRSVVQLDPARVEIIEQTSGLDADQEFLLGIDVRDPEFDDWLRDMRSRSAPTPALQAPGLSGAHRPKLPVFLATVDRHGSDIGVLQDHVLDLVQKSLRDLFDVSIFRGLPGEQDNRAMGGLIVQVQGISNGRSSRWLRASLNTTRLQSLWTGSATLDPEDSVSPDSLGVLRLSHQIVDAIAAALAQPGQTLGLATREGDVLAATAMQRMFRMRAPEVDAAEQLLQNAMAADPRGLFHAWQAQIVAIRHVEQQGGDFASLRDQSRANVAYALESEPTNSNVLAAASTARLIFENDVMQSATLARQSVLANRSNPYAWWCWSNANLYGGDYEVAYTAAVAAERLAEGSPLQFWTSFQRGITSAVRHRLDEALGHISVSSALSPNYRPALRYLVALASRLDKFETASAASQTLKDLEKGFSIDRLVRDDSYPVSLMRRANLLDLDRLTKLQATVIPRQ